MVSIIKGDLIEKGLKGELDVIGHGCNCFCVMGSGIAVPMKNTFGCDMYTLEDEKYSGSFLKLGNIQGKDFFVNEGKISETGTLLKVYNLYTQYAPGVPMPPSGIPLDYDALRLCVRKLLYLHKKAKIGLPWIGCGLAKGDKGIVYKILEEETKLYKGELFIVEL
jgi:O-acetyl-ADP-ribose deacetylase (regulator of RNase III)